MRSQCTKVQFTGQHIYVGIDVARKSWKVRIYVDQAYHKRFAQRPEPKALVEYSHRNFPGAIYHSVYEAGYFGFWIHRELTRLARALPSEISLARYSPPKIPRDQALVKFTDADSCVRMFGNSRVGRFLHEISNGFKGFAIGFGRCP